MAELTRRYLVDLTSQVAVMRDSWSAGDGAQLQQQAHRAKGTSATYRLTKLAAQFGRLEELARDRPLPDLTPVFEQIAAVIEEALHALEREGDADV